MRNRFIAIKPIATLEVALALLLIVLLGNYAYFITNPRNIVIQPSIIGANVSQNDIVTQNIQKDLFDILEQFDPFHRETTITTIEIPDNIIPETKLNLKVFGMRADLSGESSSAIIGTSDNKQAAYFIGEEIVSGVILERVEVDYVILNRNGEKERLSRDDREKDNKQNGITVVVSQSALSFKAYDMINALSFHPYRRDASLIGYRVRARRGQSLEDFGFKHDDIVTSINGQSLVGGGVNLPLLWKDFMSTRYATIQIIRDDAPLSIEVNLQ